MSVNRSLAEDEVFLHVGEGVETVRKADGIRYDRQSTAGENDEIPLLVFVGDESYRTRLSDPSAAIGVELMGERRWTIGFLDRTTDRYVTLLDPATVDNFVEMIEAVDKLAFGLSFPNSPEAKQCPDCRGTDHLNHVVELDAAPAAAFLDQVRDELGAEIPPDERTP